jgi:polyisoprenyl-teichoic acid--peptidoglycan teichoic acid transferase
MNLYYLRTNCKKIKTILFAFVFVFLYYSLVIEIPMSKKEIKEPQKIKSRIKSFLSGSNLMIFALVLIVLFQYFNTGKVLGRFSFLHGHSSSLIDEIGLLRENQFLIAEDLGEIRTVLRMPARAPLSFGEEKPAEDKNLNTNDLQIAFFQYVDSLGRSRVEQESFSSHKNLLNKLLQSEDVLELMESESLNFSDLSESGTNLALHITDENGRKLASYKYSALSFSFETVNEKTTLSIKTVPELSKHAIDFLTNQKDDVIKALEKMAEREVQVQKALNLPEVVALIQEKNMTISEDYLFINQAGDILGSIVLDTKSGRISLNDHANPDLSLEVTNIETSLLPFLKKLDTRTPLARKIDEVMENIQETIEDPGFQLLLSQNNLKIHGVPREDNLRYYYDIFTGDAEHLSSIVVEKSTGIVNIVSPEGTNAQNIFFFEPESKKKTLELPDEIPVYANVPLSEAGTFNILVAGTHGGLLDAMILVHINEHRGDIRMVSIPRDLFYNGRKINAFAHLYGMEELTRVIGEITGYRPDKYISIDMYAFIEVIDLIGGVEITLKQAVIDPFYRTVDNGKVGTLHYQPGDYHFSGVESLRLARSRYTSSDFARAERQHLILEAIKDKAKNFGFSDADIIYQIIRTVLGKTKTNISFDEAVVWFFRYQNYDIKSGGVLSSGNVLYVPPYITTENCRKMIEEAEAAGEPRPDCENQNNAYTLLPRDNNWNVIKWFFRQNFED